MKKWLSVIFAVILAFGCTLNLQVSPANAGAIPMELQANVDAKVDVNQALNQIGAVFQEAIKDENAVIYNGTDAKLQFYCYNDTDSTRLISAKKPVVAPGYTGLCNKGLVSYGPTIQVMINDKDGPYYILRRHAYIWDGQGFKEVAPKA